MWILFASYILFINYFNILQIRLLVEHGKNELKDSVYCIMRKLMTNKVAVNFNLKGSNRKGVQIAKNKFLDTETYGLVIGKIYTIYIFYNTVTLFSP